jgi:hypothetical protein
VLGEPALLRVAGDVGVGPRRERVDLHEAAAHVERHDRRPAPSARLVASQARHPRGLAGQRPGERHHLACTAAAVGVVEPSVVALDLGLHDAEVEVVALADVLDVPERLGEVVLGVEEHDLEARVDLHGEIDEHAVLERRREHQTVAELLDGPLDGGGRRLVLERRRHRGEVPQVESCFGGQLLPGHVAHSLSPTTAS